jgi:Tfp pilus assembly protein PilF
LAANEFRELVRRRTRLAMPHLNLALAIARSANPKEAETEARRGVELAPKSALARMILASVMDPARPEEAFAEAEKAAQLDPNNPRVLGFLLERIRAFPGDQKQREEAVVRSLARVAPGNLQVIFESLRFDANRFDSMPTRRIGTPLP